MVWLGWERALEFEFLPFFVFLAIFHAMRLGTNQKVIMMIYFANAALMYVLSRDTVDFFMTLGV